MKKYNSSTKILVETQHELDAVADDFSGDLRIFWSTGRIVVPDRFKELKNIYVYGADVDINCDCEAIYVYDTEEASVVRDHASNRVYVNGSAEIYADGEPRDYGAGNEGAGEIWAYDGAQITAGGKCDVYAFDGVTVKAKGECCISAADHVFVVAKGKCKILPTGHSTIIANDECEVSIWSEHTGRVTLNDNATKYVDSKPLPNPVGDGQPKELVEEPDYDAAGFILSEAKEG
jgi:hypothetical protein